MANSVECKTCGVLVHNVAKEASYAICWQCVAEDMVKMDPPKLQKKATEGFPKGWRFMKEFVHNNGTVYFKGVEQPALKGTLEPTVIVVRVKKTKVQKAQEKQQIMAQYAELKKLLKKETRKTELKKIESRLKKLQKQL